MSYILVVDDCFILRQLFSRFLGSIGLKSREARDGIEALEMIEAKMPDLVILDVDMPRMNGREVLRQLRANPKTKNLQVIFCTAHGNEAFASWAMYYGAVACLPKPCLKTDFIQLVQQTLGYREHLGELKACKTLAEAAQV